MTRSRAFLTFALTAGVLVVPAVARPLAASSATTTSTYVLYVGHGVAVVATNDLNTGCSSVYLSTNTTTWRNVTPPLKGSAATSKGQCLYFWSSASFVSPLDGWLLARNGGSTETILRHTLNGGRTWTTQPGGDTGSNGGAQTITFLSAALGWRQQFGVGSNGNFSLERTRNAGATWTTISRDPRGACVFANDVFATATRGFATVDPSPSSNATHLWRTSDGGASWSVMRLTAPATIASGALGLYGRPVFARRRGAMPVDYPVAGGQRVYFYATTDAGATWRLDTVPAPVAVAGELTINHRSAAAQPCFGGASAPVSSGLAAVSVAVNPSTWWILRPGSRGESLVAVVSLTGGHVSRHYARDLPSTRGGALLAPLSAASALITVPVPYGYQTTYETTDGGATWRVLTVAP